MTSPTPSANSTVPPQPSRNLTRQIVISVIVVALYFFGSIALPSLVSPEWGERANQLGIIGSAVIGVILFP
ncbi:hypothetical protein [Corynebacterium pseudotuberculosis]|uniref:hypothetical protein n=1 Tax=Corynebacterium pseudotuberculosis TaxID=1719 RepID=UPI001EECC2FC|nr:hypothetical protein [Corynebacterium pseudotuberculosis]WFP67166.1 hypothetical protein P8128_10585 [Corynebacterium pseudotuberculosis]